MLFIVDDSASVCDSVYNDFDPYDFIYSGSGSNSTSDPLYASVISAPTSPPPVPPARTLERREKEDKVDTWVGNTHHTT